MSGRRELIIGVSRCPQAGIVGRFHRHANPTHGVLSGSLGGGRWGPPNTFSVLYLGRPHDSVVVEAYRHLVDPYDGMTPEMVRPRNLITVDVNVTSVLDLTVGEAAESVGLSRRELESPVGDYEACWKVARAAHQLGLHGILAPAATGLGQTLALFETHLPASELPQLIDERIWQTLPSDPRRLRLISDEAST